MQNRLGIIATLVAQEGKEDALESVLRNLIAPTRAEPGCLRYDLWVSRDDPSRFTFIEEWKSEADLEAHFETPHIANALGQFGDLLGAELELQKLGPLD